MSSLLKEYELAVMAVLALAMVLDILRSLEACPSHENIFKPSGTAQKSFLRQQWMYSPFEIL